MDPQQWNFIDETVEDEFSTDEKFGRDSIICALDCSEPMFMVKTEDGMTHFELSLKVVISLYNRKCVTNENDYLGILFYNTNEKKNTHNFEHIYVFQELGLPGAEKVKEIEKLVAPKIDVRHNFRDKFGHSDSNLDEVFWICATMFNNSGLKEGTKRVFLFTNCDNPHRNDSERQKKVYQRIQDLREQAVNIELLPVGNYFSWDHFYSQALFDNDQSLKSNPADRLEELMDRAVRKQYKKRAMATVTLTLAPGVEISCSLYNTVATARLPSAVKLDRKTNDEVKTVKTFTNVETGEKLLPVDLKKYQTYGGSKIAMEPDEVEQLRKLCPQGLVLLGFQHKRLLKPSLYLRQGLFMYPNEYNVKGSSSLFRCLLEVCMAKDLVALCRLTARSNMAPRLVALQPQLEELDIKGFQEEPPGFNVVYLPFADDVRDLSRKITQQSEKVAPDEKLVNKAKEMIDKLTIDYNPDTITNPVLQTHYKAVEAFALEREDVETVVDHTKPNTDWMMRKAGQVMHEFRRLVFPDDYVPGGNYASRKRAGGDANNTQTKKSKGASDPAAINLEEEAKADRLNKLTVPILKELCALNAIKLTVNRKADIIGQINDHYKL